MVKVKVVVVVLSAFLILSEAAVTVEVLSGLSTVGTVECGKQDIIRCVVSPFPGTAGYMAWTTDSNPLTQCFDSADDCSPLSIDHYQFSSKPTDETFNLTFNTVKLSDGSVEFRCTDTINTASVTPLIKVVPDNASTTHSSSGLELEVTTGCVYPDSAITFKWYYMKNGSPVVFDNSKSEQTVDTTGCTTGDCGGQDVKKITSRLTTDSEGDEYNIHVDIIHDDVPENDPNYAVSKSFGMFKVAASTETPTTAPTTDETSDTDAIVGGTVGGVLGFCGLIAAAAVVGIRHLNKKKKGSTTTLSIVEGRKVTFSCPFPESVTFPEWRGPPGLAIYTSSDDTLGRINSKIPAFNRLQYASNKRDLILSDAVISDSGDYRCSYTGQGDHTITLKVNRGKGYRASNVVNTGSHPEEMQWLGRPQPPLPNSNHSHDRNVHHPANIVIPTRRAGALEPISAREEV